MSGLTRGLAGIVKAARVFGHRDLRVVDSPDPVPKKGEALLSVQAVAICPADMRLYRHFESGGARSTVPLVIAPPRPPRVGGG